MSPEQAVEIGRSAVQTALLVASPMLISGMIIGLIVSVFQAATQINETTLTFVPKIFVVLISLIFFAPWMIQTILTFATSLLGNLGTLTG